MLKTYTRDPKLIAADMSGETVLMSIDNGQYYGLSEVGARIWDTLENQVTLDDIVRHICEYYDVSENSCRTDTEKFLDDLISAGLVRTS